MWGEATTCKKKRKKNNAHIFCPDPPSVFKRHELYSSNGVLKLFLYGVSGVVGTVIDNIRISNYIVIPADRVAAVSNGFLLDRALHRSSGTRTRAYYNNINI